MLSHDIQIHLLEVFSIELAPAVKIVAPQSTLYLGEGRRAGAYSVVLTHAPTADVTVTISPDQQLSTSATQLRFTPQDWNLPQTVLVQAVADNIVEGDHTGVVTHTVASDDARYTGMAFHNDGLVDNTLKISIADGSDRVIVGGSTLLSKGDVLQLEAWLGEGPLTLTKIYSKREFDDARDFHHAVDGKGRTFSVMHATANNYVPATAIIGGYNPQSWESNSSRRNIYHFTYGDNERTAFLFNLTTRTKYFQ